MYNNRAKKIAKKHKKDEHPEDNNNLLTKNIVLKL